MAYLIYTVVKIHGYIDYFSFNSDFIHFIESFYSATRVSNKVEFIEEIENLGFDTIRLMFFCVNWTRYKSACDKDTR